MKKTLKQKKRIIENIFDLILNTSFIDEAKKQMKEDLKNKNIDLSLDEKDLSIRIQDNKGEKTQYKISII